jgi:hypothetical protein
VGVSKEGIFMSLTLLIMLLTFLILGIVSIITLILFKIFYVKKIDASLYDFAEYDFPYIEKIDDTTIDLLEKTKIKSNSNARLYQSLIVTDLDLQLMNLNTNIPVQKVY